VTDFPNTSLTSCRTEELEYACAVSSIASTLKSQSDNKNDVLNIALDVASEMDISDKVGRDETDVEVTCAVCEVTSTTDYRVDRRNSATYSTVCGLSSDSEVMPDVACQADCVDSSYSSAVKHCDVAAAAANDTNTGDL